MTCHQEKNTAAEVSFTSGHRVLANESFFLEETSIGSLSGEQAAI